MKVDVQNCAEFQEARRRLRIGFAMKYFVSHVEKENGYITFHYGEPPDREPFTFLPEIECVGNSYLREHVELLKKLFPELFL